MIRAGIRRLFRLPLHRRDHWEREVEDEIKLHLALRAEQLAAQGYSLNEAQAEAIRRFGPLHEARAQLLDAARHREERMRRSQAFADLRQDVAFALRTFGRERAWAAVTLLTLALGIGATTAVFSVVSTLLLHPLPYPHADRVVYVNQQASEGNNTGISVTIAPSASVVRAWMKSSRSFETLEGEQLGPRTLKTTSGEPSRVAVESVFPTFFEFAGQRPLIGRAFTAADIEAGIAVALLGESFWRNRLAADPRVLGQRITLGDSSFMIVGVVPAALHAGLPTARPADVWIPLDVRNDKLGMSLMGRLRRGVTTGGAMKELDSIYARSAGFTSAKIPFRTVISTPAQRVRFRDSLVMLTWAVALVLLVACANVAHLLLARSAARQRERAIRVALGAGAGRLLRQLLTETLILSLVGAACGVLVGWSGLRALIAARPPSLDSLAAAHLDATTLAAAIAAALLSGLGFAFVAALHTARQSVSDALKTASPAASPSRGQRLRSGLVISEMALSATLLVGATLLVRSVINLQRADLGFDPNGLYAVDIRFPKGAGFDSPTSQDRLLADFMARVRALSHVRSAAIADVAPGSRNFSIGRLEIEHEQPPPRGSSSFIEVNHVQPDYFATLGIRLRYGTTFTDTTVSTRQVIVNEGFARKHWNGGGALGQRIRIARTDSEPWLTIVGVATDAQLAGPTAESTAPMLYAPRVHSGGPANLPGRGHEVLIRVDGGAESLTSAVAMLAQMGLKRVPPPEGVADTIARSLAAPRFVMMLLTIFTVLALILAGVGLYGLMAYAVAQRTREIGIRVALGASDGRIARAVIAEGARLAAVGAFIGIVSSVWGTKLLENQLRGVARWDPASLAIGAAVLLAAALVACIVPTRRALAVDPMTAIRAD